MLKHPHETSLAEYPLVGRIMVCLRRMQQVGDWQIPDWLTVWREARDSRADKEVPGQLRIFEMIKNGQEIYDIVSCAWQHEIAIKVHIVDENVRSQTLGEHAGGMQTVEIGRCMIDDFDSIA